MHLLVISGVTKIKDYKVIKRRKLEIKIFEKVVWQEDWGWEVKPWLLAIVQGHVEEDT